MVPTRAKAGLKASTPRRSKLRHHDRVCCSQICVQSGDSFGSRHENSPNSLCWRFFASQVGSSNHRCTFVPSEGTAGMKVVAFSFSVVLLNVDAGVVAMWINHQYCRKVHQHTEYESCFVPSLQVGLLMFGGDFVPTCFQDHTQRPQPPASKEVALKLWPWAKPPLPNRVVSMICARNMESGFSHVLLSTACPTNKTSWNDKILIGDCITTNFRQPSALPAAAPAAASRPQGLSAWPLQGEATADANKCHAHAAKFIPAHRLCGLAGIGVVHSTAPSSPTLAENCNAPGIGQGWVDHMMHTWHWARQASRHWARQAPRHWARQAPRHWARQVPRHWARQAPRHWTRQAPRHWAHQAPRHWARQAPRHWARQAPRHWARQAPRHWAHQAPRHWARQAPRHWARQAPRHWTCQAPRHWARQAPRHWPMHWACQAPKALGASSTKALGTSNTKALSASSTKVLGASSTRSGMHIFNMSRVWIKTSPRRRRNREDMENAWAGGAGPKENTLHPSSEYPPAGNPAS
eukprot:gene1548-biopygen21352